MVFQYNDKIIPQTPQLIVYLRYIHILVTDHQQNVYVETNDGEMP